MLSVRLCESQIGISMMKRETGSRESPIWLLGDSNPKNWHADLATPFDPRHPAIHSIWTPILEGIQDRLFRASEIRVDTSPLYIRNAIENPSNKPPSNVKEWSPDISHETSLFGGLITRHMPRFVFSFGAFSFEFARRSLGEEPRMVYSKWGAKELGQQFRNRIGDFDIGSPNIIPLLHVSIARGRFMKAHEYYCDDPSANYFEHVAEFVSRLLLAHSDELGIWIH